jgi:hypothetical protein
MPKSGRGEAFEGKKDDPLTESEHPKHQAWTMSQSSVRMQFDACWEAAGNILSLFLVQQILEKVNSKTRGQGWTMHESDDTKRSIAN